ncbi:amino acid ABC transporter substrate-binding protein [Enterococcus saccharolyticus]|uniref:Amino acid ABC transporter substrate-binding protein n=1 Tax=Candidatus Enterococcus willemsii TaxID=1857215 RepID=A0ABQ6YYA2_9ENTE|nr:MULTISPECIES: amino acid ABC transporter substrate-binding protein [Enterococcus]KAF1303057.1 amino acid ABC transporter substrate-binding protein [Enterococcus sp. CU12B]MCD5001594.1 amino acid ABC transporter substrate-binding protein [Enterococcus saccharolyticus]
MKKLTGLVMVVGLLVLGACGTGDKKERESAADKKEVVVGLDDTFVPMGFRDDNGELTGFDIELATAVFDLSDTKVTFQPIDWAMKETELDNGTIDMIWNGYTVTPEREKKVLFSDGYMTTYQVLVTAKDSKITETSQMKDKVLGAQEGSSGYKAFTEQPELLQDLVKDNDATLYASFNEAFIDLEKGRIDGLLVDRVYAEYYLTQADQLADFNVIETPFEKEDFAVGVRKEDDKLAQKINEAFTELKDNGTFAKISEKWFGEDVSAE